MLKQVGHRFGRHMLNGPYLSGQDMAKYMRSDPYGFAGSCGTCQSMKKKTQESCHILIREQPKPSRGLRFPLKQVGLWCHIF